MTHIIKNHIAKQILRSLELETCAATASSLASLLFIGKYPELDCVQVNLSNKHLSSLVGDYRKISAILNVKDTFIQNVSQKQNESLEHFISFSIPKQVFMSTLFNEVPILRNLQKKLIVEYSSPNVAKPFHMGHLRSTVVGNFIANIQGISNDVLRLNYLGDWGTQVGFVKVGLDSMGINFDSTENPIRTLHDAYVKANENASLLEMAKLVFAKLEKGADKEGLREWEKIRRITVKHLEATYKRLGIQFDEYSCESLYSSNSLQPIINKLESQGYLFSEDSQLKVKVGDKLVPFLKSDGTSLYLSRDVAAALDRHQKHGCDTILYVVDKSQSEHMKALKYIVDSLVGRPLVEHVAFGRVVGMSTRKGTSVFLSDILDQATHRMAEQQAKSPNTRASSQEVTNVLAVSALMIYILKQRRLKDFRFDWELALQGTGDTGVKLQYTHSRLVSLENKCGVDVTLDCDASLLKEDIIFQLVLELSRFEEIVLLCQNEAESSPLVNYLFKLSNLISRALKVLPVKNQSKEVAQQRLMLFNKSRQVLNNGMKILGLQPLNSM